MAMRTGERIAQGPGKRRPIKEARLPFAAPDVLRALVGHRASADVVEHLVEQIADVQRRMDYLDHVVGRLVDRPGRADELEQQRSILRDWRVRRRVLIELWEFTTNQVWRLPDVEP